MSVTMTAEEFLAHCNSTSRDKGKARLNRARRAYAAYVRAYREESLYDLVLLAINRRHGSEADAIRRAAKDRDEGCSMVMVPELM